MILKTLHTLLLAAVPCLLLSSCASGECDGEVYEGATAEVKNGSTVLATNPNVEKFLQEVTYPDKDLSFTKVLDYYGGFNGKSYDGKTFNWDNRPDSDKPCSYSIRWKLRKSQLQDPITLVLSDKYGWEASAQVPAGSFYTNITNLVPNDTYNFKVSTGKGKVLTKGTFTTTGSLHQVFFRGNEEGTVGVRNARDLGGWKTLDGKTVKYRKIYRGGRMNDPWEQLADETGKKEVQFEGIKAQLDLRGHSDVMQEPLIEGMAHCAPSIEQGGTAMLKADAPKTKQCFEFVLDCVRNNKPVYFHCSLGRDRTGTLDILLLGLLGVREGDISKAYEVTYFAPVGYSVSSSEKDFNPTPIYMNTRMEWAYADVVPYFWSFAGENGTFAEGVEKYLLDVAGVSQADIDEFRKLMLE